MTKEDGIGKYNLRHLSFENGLCERLRESQAASHATGSQ